MRAAKYATGTGLISGVRSGEVLPDLPDGMAYLPLADDEPCDPDRQKVVGGVLVARLALDGETLDRLRAQRWAEAKVHREATMAGGCATPLGRVDTDAESQRKILGSIELLKTADEMGQPRSVDWTMSDNSVVTHDLAALRAMAVAVGVFIDECQKAGTAIRAAINAADDPAAVDIYVGYPA